MKEHNAYHYILPFQYLWTKLDDNKVSIGGPMDITINLKRFLNVVEWSPAAQWATMFLPPPYAF